MKKKARFEKTRLSQAEQFIIGQALLEVKTLKDIPVVRERVSGTVVGINKKSMGVFDHLVEQKKKGGLIK